MYMCCISSSKHRVLINTGLGYKQVASFLLLKIKTWSSLLAGVVSASAKRKRKSHLIKVEVGGVRTRVHLTTAYCIAR